jgi:AcrR family transcriptional regulator
MISARKVAAENFFKKGYTKTKIDDITSALKVTKPYVYYHFSNKLEILEEICGRTSVFAADLAESAAEHTSGRSVVDRLRTFVRNFALTVIAERMFLSIYFRESKHLPKRTRDRFRNDRRRFHAALSRILTEGRDSGHFSFTDLSVTEQTVTGMVTWIFNWYQPDGKKSAEEVAVVMEDLILAAVGASIARHKTAAERGRMTADAKGK